MKNMMKVATWGLLQINYKCGIVAQYTMPSIPILNDVAER